MSTPTSIYESIGQETVGTENYLYTDKLNNLVPYGEDEFDKSILYSSWNKRLELYPDLCTNNKNTNEIPVKIFTFNDEDLINFKLSDSSSATNVTLTTRLMYKPQIEPKKATMSNVFVNSSNAYIFGDVGAYSTVYSSLTSTQKGTHNFYRDVQYDKIIFSFPALQGFLKNSESKEIIDIDIDDFLKNPDNYYVSTMLSLPPARYMWNGSTYVNSNGKIANNYYTEFDGFKGFKFSYPFSSGVKKVSMYYGVKNSNYDKGNVGKHLGRCSYPNTTSGSIAYIKDLQIGNYTTGGFGERYSPVNYTGLILSCPAPDYYVETAPSSTQVNLLKEEWVETDNAIHNVKYYSKYSTSPVSSSDKRYQLNNFYAEVTSYIDGRFVYNYLSGIGCYFVKGNLPSNITPDTIDTFDNIYLGEIDDKGYATLKFINGKDLYVYEGNNKHGNTTNENYDPGKVPDTDDEDELDDSEITINANGNSFIKWFAVTGQNLLQLINAFESENVPAGFVPLDHIVGVYQTPFNIPDYSNCGSLTNIFVGKYDTNVQGMPLLNQGNYSTTGFIASKYIEPTHNNFLDYEPYTSLSIYLPYCGSCNLDANLFVGKTVNVEYYFDIFSGDVIANVYANKTLYKTLSGNFTISQPITSQNVGLQKDTVIKGAVGVATNMIGTAGFAMSGNISGALSGAVGATISSISTYTHLNGISPVSTKGGGGRSIFYTCKNVILYKSTAIENHGDYQKYRGKVCNYDSKLSDCHGYTVVENPHIEIKCTNTEKDEITKLLEQGVILP